MAARLAIAAAVAFCLSIAWMQVERASEEAVQQARATLARGAPPAGNEQ